MLKLVKYEFRKSLTALMTLLGLTAGLEAMSPLKVLSRGYAIVKTEDRIVKSVQDVQCGDTLCVQLTDGTVVAEAKERRSL